jgi:hypothetical protein
MSVHAVLAMANELSREDKALLCTSLGEIAAPETHRHAGDDRPAHGLVGGLLGQRALTWVKHR